MRRWGSWPGRNYLPEPYRMVGTDGSDGLMAFCSLPPATASKVFLYIQTKPARNRGGVSIFISLPICVWDEIRIGYGRADLGSRSTSLRPRPKHRAIALVVAGSVFPPGALPHAQRTCISLALPPHRWPLFATRHGAVDGLPSRRPRRHKRSRPPTGGLPVDLHPSPSCCHAGRLSLELPGRAPRHGR